MNGSLSFHGGMLPPFARGENGMALIPSLISIWTVATPFTAAEPFFAPKFSFLGPEIILACARRPHRIPHTLFRGGSLPFLTVALARIPDEAYHHHDSQLRTHTLPPLSEVCAWRLRLTKAGIKVSEKGGELSDDDLCVCSRVIRRREGENSWRASPIGSTVCSVGVAAARLAGGRPYFD